VKNLKRGFRIIFVAIVLLFVWGAIAEPLVLPLLIVVANGLSSILGNLGDLLLRRDDSFVVWLRYWKSVFGIVTWIAIAALLVRLLTGTFT
jgi:uncharacterized membrane protein